MAIFLIMFVRHSHYYRSGIIKASRASKCIEMRHPIQLIAICILSVLIRIGFYARSLAALFLVQNSNDRSAEYVSSHCRLQWTL